MTGHDTSDEKLLPIWALSSDSFDPAHRFDAWHAACGAFNDIAVPSDERSGFHAATSYWSLGQLTLATSVAPRMRLFRSEPQALRDQLDQDVVVVFVEGSSDTRSGDHHYGLATGEVAFGNLRRGYDFRITSPEGARWIELICPSAVRERLLEIGAGKTRVGGAHSPQSRLLGQFLVNLAQQLPRLTATDLPLIEQALLCLLAAAQKDGSPGSAPLSDAGRQTVDRARAKAVIERELFSARLSADRVCDVTGISRSSLYRLFESDNGVASYIRMRRLDALRSDLLDPRKRNQSVAQLAEARGFHSLSTLNRTFRRRFNCTPGEMRSTPAQPVVPSDIAGIENVMTYLRTQPHA